MESVSALFGNLRLSTLLVGRFFFLARRAEVLAAFGRIALNWPLIRCVAIAAFEKSHLTRTSCNSMNIQPLTDHVRLRDVFLIAATFAAIASGVSARTEMNQPAAATPAPVQQSATSVLAEMNFPTETPSSMAYHDNINVSAIAVAAYDH